LLRVFLFVSALRVLAALFGWPSGPLLAAHPASPVRKGPNAVAEKVDDRDSDADDFIHLGWQFSRQLLIYRINDAASYFARGLPVCLHVRAREADTWAENELKCRARAMKVWARPVALCCPERFAKLPGEVAAAIEHSAIGNWSALPTTELSDGPSRVQLLVNLLRKAATGILPLLVLAIAPYIDLSISAPVRDSLLTFAVPWLLLLLIEQISPGSRDDLSNVETLRAWTKVDPNGTATTKPVE
jgi:hypothetical protein